MAWLGGIEVETWNQMRATASLKIDYGSKIILEVYTLVLVIFFHHATDHEYTINGKRQCKSGCAEKMITHLRTFFIITAQETCSDVQWNSEMIIKKWAKYLCDSRRNPFHCVLDRYILYPSSTLWSSENHQVSIDIRNHITLQGVSASCPGSIDCDSYSTREVLIQTFVKKERYFIRNSLNMNGSKDFLYHKNLRLRFAQYILYYRGIAYICCSSYPQ
ncbi:unnamed protein product [Albugo candida]|uniref:Uncharacterized protein n=1 Tax=Albugo candida TaxID=65357 RepID=A0A024GG66_9STRA|nr:unnamed protein product [Albugo candida]|eukprot:CCI45699.1 unnamed protein product [Albugo candida]